MNLVTRHYLQDFYELIVSPIYPQSLGNSISEAEDMPAFLRRLRRRFSRRSERTYSFSTPPLQQRLSRPSATNNSRHDGRYSIDTMYTKSINSCGSQEALPVITDRGPPGRNDYANEDIFWNSIMLEADHDPVRYPWSSMTPGQKPGFHDIKAAVDVDLESPNSESIDAIREEIHKDPSPSPPVRRYTDWPMVGLEGTIPRHGIRRRRTDNDIIVMLAPSLDNESVSRMPLPRSRPRAPTALDEYSEHTYNPPAQRIHLPALSPAGQYTGGDGTQDDEVLTWNSVLNQILASDAVDPFTRDRVHERVNISSITNGTGHGKHPVTARGTGFVPNFSRPICRSSFYARTDVELQVRSDKEHGTDQMGIVHGEPKEKLPNGVHYSDSPTPSAVSSGTLYRFPTPPSAIPAELEDLLTTNLSSSEFCLYSRLIGLPSPDRSPSWPFPPSSTSNSTSSSSLTPLHARLVHRLHTILLGLQDRNTDFEEDLVPRISDYLTDKTNKVDSLHAKIAFQNEQIIELKNCIDYASKILRGCWSREWELWYTLMDIRRHRLANLGTVKRLLSRRVNRQVSRLASEERIMQSAMPDGYLCRIDGRGPDFVGWDEERSVSGRRGMAEKELDALMLMAKQNVDILKVDMGEVVYMMREFWWNINNARDREAEREYESSGSWRDL